MKNCPFCNEVMWATDLVYHEGPGLWAPVCGNCLARGPLHGHKQAAMDAWDRAVRRVELEKAETLMTHNYEAEQHALARMEQLRAELDAAVAQMNRLMADYAALEARKAQMNREARKAQMNRLMADYAALEARKALKG